MIGLDGKRTVKGSKGRIPTAAPLAPDNYASSLFLFVEREVGEKKKMKFLSFKRIVEEVTVFEVLSLIGWTWRYKCGDVMRGSCPIHGSTSRTSRTFKCELRVWFCHKCKKGGDVINLWSLLKGLTLRQAAEQLTDLFHVRMDPCPRPR